MAWGFVLGIVTLPYQWVRDWRQRRKAASPKPCKPPEGHP
jgi:hypothetical protein